MARLIDANELDRKIAEITKEPAYQHTGEDWLNGLCMAMEAVNEAPTVDAVEVVHGRWIQSEPGYRLCSHCMADVAIYSGHRNYCPNCGARMDGDGNDR